MDTEIEQKLAELEEASKHYHAMIDYLLAAVGELEKDRQQCNGKRTGSSAAASTTR